MSSEINSLLDVSYTYLLPMREDNPAFADFDRLYGDVAEVMGEGYLGALVTRISTILAGNGVTDSKAGVLTHHAFQESGRVGSVKAVTFKAPLTVEGVSTHIRYVGPVAARAIVDFAIRMHAHCENKQA